MWGIFVVLKWELYANFEGQMFFVSGHRLLLSEKAFLIWEISSFEVLCLSFSITFHSLFWEDQALNQEVSVILKMSISSLFWELKNYIYLLTFQT